jgi:transposase
MDSVVGDNLGREDLRRLVDQLLGRVEQLERRLADTQQELDQANAKIQRLEGELDQTRRKLAAAQKNSSNSSKPPSSDIVKPPQKDRKKKSRRRRGGQPGHPKHERPMLKPDEVHHHTLDACPHCGGGLTHVPDGTRVVQQIKIVAKPIHVEEHRGRAYFCQHCNKMHYAPLPPEVKNGGLFDATMTALVAYLKGACHMSFSTICKFLRDVLKVTVSRGYLVNLIRKVTGSLESAYAALQQLLPTQDAVHTDETGHPHPGPKRHWTWCFRAPEFVLFKNTDSRGADVLWEMLGSEFKGVLGCDYFSAYRKYMKACDIRVQFCLAHLIRELKYMTTLPDRATQIYAESLLMAMRDMFAVIHRRETMSPESFVRALEKRRQAIVAMATRGVPATREAQNLAGRFHLHGAAYFEFITSPEISPTNNLAEQAIRFVVIDRHITQGTRSELGLRWCERIWTVMATCAQQGRSAFEFLLDSVHACLNGRSPPNLIVNPS